MLSSFSTHTRRELIRVASALETGSPARRALCQALLIDGEVGSFRGLDVEAEGRPLVARETVGPSFDEGVATGHKWDASRDKDLAARARKGDISEEERKALLYSPYPFMTARSGQNVAVHLNLGHKKKAHGLKTWSVKPSSGRSIGGRTLGHVFGAVLKDALFVVGASGQSKAEGGEKTVHAAPIGRLVTADPPGRAGSRTGVQIRYNPHQGMKWFMRQNPETGAWDIPVVGAKEVHLAPDWSVWAKGAVDMDPEKAARLASRTPTKKPILRAAVALPKGSEERKTLIRVAATLSQ